MFRSSHFLTFHKCVIPIKLVPISSTTVYNEHNKLKFKTVHILTKLSTLTKLGRFRAAITWLAATWGELTPLGKAILSAVVWLFKLSTSEAEEEGDSPDKMQEQEWK